MLRQRRMTVTHKPRNKVPGLMPGPRANGTARVPSWRGKGVSQRREVSVDDTRIPGRMLRCWRARTCQAGGLDCPVVGLRATEGRDEIACGPVVRAAAGNGVQLSVGKLSGLDLVTHKCVSLHCFRFYEGDSPQVVRNVDRGAHQSGTVTGISGKLDEFGTGGDRSADCPESQTCRCSCLPLGGPLVSESPHDALPGEESAPPRRLCVALSCPLRPLVPAAPLRRTFLTALCGLPTVHAPRANDVLCPTVGHRSMPTRVPFRTGSEGYAGFRFPPSYGALLTRHGAARHRRARRHSVQLRAVPPGGHTALAPRPGSGGGSCPGYG